MNPKNYPPLTSPEDIPARFTEVWNERDAKKLAALFDEDAEFVNVVGIWWHNREDIYKAHDYGLRVIFNHSTLKQGRTKVKYLSDDIALVHCRFRLTNQTPLNDTRPETRQTLFSFVVHQVDGGNSWSCASAHNTDVIPGKETHMMKNGEIEAVDYRKADER
ncbi:YybH family protein [Rhodohalobacter sp. 8-1]|uniref:YybH family protein n=1 Tax=Rhodohalobacter sp. 8-1 TaxID=3131972 RepID=UPI0030EB3FAF